MESKREEIAKKLDKFAFNVKNIDRVIAFMVALFIVFAFVVYTRKKTDYEQRQAAYSRMLAELEEHQLNVIYANVSPNDGDSSGTYVKEKSMFENGIDAAAYAFEQLRSSKCYETEGYGFVQAEALGQHVEVEMNFKSAQYEDGTQFDENIRKETKTNFGQTEAIQLVFKNGVKYKRTGSNIRSENGAWVADFSGSFSPTGSSVTKKPVIEVRKDTIQFCKDFTFTRTSTGKIAYYKTTVLVDRVKSVVDYAKNIQEEGGTSLPQFSFIQVSCIIDGTGHLLSYTTIETMSLTKTIVVEVNTTMTTETTVFVKSYDQTPSIPYPQV